LNIGRLQLGRKEEMIRSDTWDLIQGKMLELRILTNANWKNSEWELAALEIWPKSGLFEAELIY